MKTTDQVLLEQAYQAVSQGQDFQPLINELGKGIPGPAIFDLLNTVKSQGKVPELIEYLNDLGNEDGDKWFLKDNLIKILFKVLPS